MDILKLLKTGLTALSLTLSCNVFAQTSSFQEVNLKNSNSIRYSFLELANGLIKKYDSPNYLAVEFMDASNPAVLRFYNSVTNRNNDEHMAVSYFNKFNIDGQDISTCFVFYEPSKKIFEGYMSRGFTQEETFKYLVGHEMGHCFARHQKPSMVENTDARGNELLADLFVIADNMNNNNYNLAVKIINFVKLSNDKIHETSPFTEKFLLEANEKNLFKNYLPPSELLDLIYTFFEKNYVKM